MRWMAKFPLIPSLLFLLFSSLFLAPGFVPSQEVLDSPRENLDVKTAYEKRLSEIPITAEGRVIKLLDDDLQGRRHQRFILRTDHGQTLLIAHNIDVAPRAAIKTGVKVRVHGEYLWNLQGGIIHKTHHSTSGGPDGLGAGGWIEVISTGKRYD